MQEEPYISDVILGLQTSILGLSNLQVVKLIEGPALAGVPEKITNFWDFLYSWGGTWMWEGIDDDQTTKRDVTWIAEGMRNNLLIWVADCSYDRKKAMELSGLDNLLHLDRSLLDRHLLGEVKLCELVLCRNVRSLCATPIRASGG